MWGNKLSKLLYCFVFIVCFLLIKNTLAQNAINSPYTRFGLGWIVESRFETRLMGMGGIRYGMQDAALINSANPASLVLISDYNTIAGLKINMTLLPGLPSALKLR